MRLECEKLTGRRREICEGTADLPAYKINAYRQSWGLDSVPDEELNRNLVESIKQRVASIKERRSARPPRPRKSKGPGTELSRLLSSLGIKPRADCSCNLLIKTMDSLGPEGCRQNKEKLLKLMQKNQDKYGWGSYLRAGFNAVRTGWVFKLNPLNPLPGLFDEAIRLAEQDQ